MASEPQLQMIQAVVTRLATQSTTVKGWCVTVTAALLGFGTTTTNPLIAAVAAYVVVAFAALDGYYLALERAYRRLYRKAAAGDATPWTLDVDQPRPADVAAAMRTPAIALLYGASLLATGSVAVYLATK
jgi:hypothetical protein